MLALARAAVGCFKRATGLARPLSVAVSSSGSGNAAAPLWGTLPLSHFLSCTRELWASSLQSFWGSSGMSLPRGFGTSASPRQEPDSVLEDVIDASNLAGLVSIIQNRGAQFRHPHYAAAFRRISELQTSGNDCKEVLRRLGSCIHNGLKHKSLDEISLMRIFHSLAGLRIRHRPLVELAMGRELRSGTPSHPSFIDRLAQALVDRGFENKNPKNLSLCMWSVAKLEYRHDALMRMCMQQALAVGFSGFNSHDLSNCLYAGAMLEINFHDPGTYNVVGRFIHDCMAACMRSGFQHFTEQGLVNTFWAVATLFYKTQSHKVEVELFPIDSLHNFADAWLTYVARLELHNFSQQGIANMFVALFKLRHYNAEFLSHLKSHATKNRLSQFSTQGLTNVIHGLATFWALSNDFVLDWSRCINDSVAQQFTAQAATVSLWSLAVWYTMLLEGALPPADRDTLEAADRAVWTLYRRFVQLYDADRGSIQCEHLLQIYQVMDRVRRGEELRMLRPALSRACFEAACDTPDTPSGFQDQVFRAFKAMGHDVSWEVATPDGVMTVDIVLRTRGGRRIAVEADGPWHFSSNKPHRPDGALHVRNAMLQQRGFDHVLSVPFYEWSYLTDQQKQEYLARKLSKLDIAA